MDPYTILNLPRGFTLEQLKYNYKVLARQLHPDKCGNRISREEATATFQVLTAAYKQLLKELDRAKADRQFDELRNGSRGEISSSSKSMSEADLREVSKRFDLSKFNNVFDDNRIGDDEVDGGYADWMSRTDPGSTGGKQNRQLVTYKEPQPVTVSRKGTTPFSELGTGKVKDYSRNDVTSQSVQFTDYRVAHTTTKLADEEGWVGQRPDFRTIDALLGHRAAMPMVMTPEEAAAQARRSARQAVREDKRVRVLSDRDAAIAASYERQHMQLLGYAPSSALPSR